VRATDTPGTRSRHLASLMVAATVVGVLVWLTARRFAAGSCPEHDLLQATSTCQALVGSLAIRVGAVAGVAVLLMELVSEGLRRTAETMERDRRVAAREGSSGSATR
jgi:hypothetical protein